MVAESVTFSVIGVKIPAGYKAWFPFYLVGGKVYQAAQFWLEEGEEAVFRDIPVGEGRLTVNLGTEYPSGGRVTPGVFIPFTPGAKKYTLDLSTMKIAKAIFPIWAVILGGLALGGAIAMARRRR